MPKHKPSRQPGSEAVPFLWTDLVASLDTWSLRPVRKRRRRDGFIDQDSEQVAATVQVLVDRQSLRAGPRYAVPLRWVYDELRRDCEPGLGRSRAGAYARSTLVNALNDDDSGLELVPCRRLALAA